MEQLSFTDGLQIISKLMDKNGRYLPYIKADSAKQKKKQQHQTHHFNFGCFWRRSSLISIVFFMVCVCFSALFRNELTTITNISILMLFVSIFGWFFNAVSNGIDQDKNHIEVKPTVVESDDAFVFAKKSLVKIGATDDLINTIPTSDFVSTPFGGITFADLENTKRSFAQKVDDLTKLLAFVQAIGKSDESELIINNYIVMKAISTGMVQTANIVNNESDDYKKLQVQYDLRFDSLMQDLYNLCEPDLNRVVLKVIEHKDYELLPKQLQESVIHTYNTKLLADLENEGDC